jgi:hypothetical protein
VAELGMGGESLLVFSFQFSGKRERRELAECRLAIPIAARLCPGALVESRKNAEAKNAEKVNFWSVRSVGPLMDGLSAGATAWQIKNQQSDIIIRQSDCFLVRVIR